MYGHISTSGIEDSPMVSYQATISEISADRRSGEKLILAGTDVTKYLHKNGTVSMPYDEWNNTLRSNKPLADAITEHNRSNGGRADKPSRKRSLSESNELDNPTKKLHLRMDKLESLISNLANSLSKLTPSTEDEEKTDGEKTNESGRGARTGSKFGRGY